MVSCTRTSHVSFFHAYHASFDTCDDDATEHEGFGTAVRQSSVRHQTTMATAGTLPSYFYRREVQPGDAVSLEPAEPSRKANERDEVEDEDDAEGVLKYDLSCSDEDSEEQSHGNENDEADNDVGVGDIFWLQGQLAFYSERFSGSEELFASITELHPKPFLWFTEKSEES